MFNNHSNQSITTLVPNIALSVLILLFGGLTWASFSSKNQSKTSSTVIKKIHQTYQVNWLTTSRMNIEDSNNYTPFPLAEAIKNEVEGLETVAQVQLFGKGFLQTGNRPALRLNEIVFAAPELTNVFAFNTLNGDLNVSLSTKNEVALSESTAKRLFGNANPIGQIVHLNNNLELKVTSIFKPQTGAYATAQVLISFATLNDDILGGFPMNTWTDERKNQIYVITNDNQTISPINNQLEKIARTYTHKTSRLSAENTFVLKAFKDIYQSKKTVLNNNFAMK